MTAFPRGPSAAGAAALAGLTLLTLLSLTPPALFLAASSIAGALGCPLDEGSPHPCRLGGRDIGGALHEAAVLGGWLSLLAAPAVLAVLPAWSWVAVRRLRRGRRAAGVRTG